MHYRYNASTEMNSDYKQGLLQNWTNLSIEENRDAIIILPYGLICVNPHKQEISKFSSKS